MIYFDPSFARCFEGALESCVAPILILIISMFYTKKEQVRSMHFSLKIPHNISLLIIGPTNLMVLHYGTTLFTAETNKLTSSAERRDQDLWWICSLRMFFNTDTHSLTAPTGHLVRHKCQDTSL